VSAADRDRWDARHAVATGGVARPPDALRGRLDLLPSSGRALDLACGRGAVATWLARRGLRVDGVDVSPAGLAAAAELARRAGVTGRVRWWLHDLDRGLPAGCAGPYDVVVCQRFRDPALYAPTAARLAPGGLLAVSVLSEVEEDPGPFRARPGELRAAFGHLEVLAHQEGGGEAVLVARRPLTPAARPDPPGSPPARPGPS
jgi:2-polyprenyl-3-methyl-5-hydroxy-6-metoxy-1,4-benzoquinol methylase